MNNPKTYYVYASEDIYTRDTLIYTKHELIGNLKDIEELPRGRYYVKEKKMKTIYVEVRDANTNKLIPHVKIGLFNEYGEMIYETYSDFIYQVPVYGTFYIVQLELVEGYHLNNDIYPIKDHIIILDKPTSLSVNLIDRFGKHIKGKHLTLHSNHQLFDEWITDRTHTIYYLKENRKYVIKVRDSPIRKEFIFNENMTVINVEMEEKE